MAIGLGLLGCSEEEIFEEGRTQEINGIISQFSPETFGKVVSGDYKVNLDVSAPLENSEELGADYYEFEISLPENQIQITSKLYDIKQSLLAVKKENGQYDFYVAKYFMDRWKSEGYSVKDVSLSKMGSFSGLLNVFNNNNQMTYAKRMDNGNTLEAPVSLNSDFNNNIETRMEEDCETEVTMYHYVESYKPVYNEGYTAILYYEFDFIFLTGISYETTCYANYFPELNLEGGVPGTYYSQNGGGSYAGCNDPNGCVYNVETRILEPDDTLGKIMKTHNLSELELNTLKQTLSEVLEKHCVYRKMYDYLVQNQVRLDFMIDSSTGAGGYSPTSKKITFNNTSTLSSSSVLIEELFHAYQDHYYSNGISQYNRTTGFSNIEFEAKFIRDLIQFGYNGYICCSIFVSTSTNYTNQDILDYQDWLDNITQYGTVFPDINSIQSSYFTWMNKFKNANSQYNYPVDNSLLPTAVFNLFSADCL